MVDNIPPELKAPNYWTFGGERIMKSSLAEQKMHTMQVTPVAKVYYIKIRPRMLRSKKNIIFLWNTHQEMLKNKGK